MLIGFGVGYVLGAKAGKERYQQIRSWVTKAAENPAVAQVIQQGNGVVNRLRQYTASGLEAGSEGLASVSQNPTQD